MDKLISSQIVQTLNLLDLKQVEDFKSIINKFHRFFLYGTGRTGLVLRMFVVRLNQMEKEAHLIGDFSIPPAGKTDCVIIASSSGNSDNVLLKLKEANKIGCTIISISSNRESDLYELSDYFVFIGAESKDSIQKIEHQPMGSLFEQVLLIMLDSLVWKIALERNLLHKMKLNHANLE